MCKKMPIEFLEVAVLKWAEEKGIFEKSDVMRQCDKTQEEALEYDEAVIDYWNYQSEENREKLLLEAGDILVTLINGLHFVGSDLGEALSMAYEKISKRRGKMVDGQFVKDGE